MPVRERSIKEPLGFQTLTMQSHLAALSAQSIATGHILTAWKTASEEHVEEVLRRDVCFKLAVVVMSVPSSATPTRRLLISKLIIAPTLFRVAQDGISVANGWESTVSNKPFPWIIIS